MKKNDLDPKPIAGANCPETEAASSLDVHDNAEELPPEEVEPAGLTPEEAEEARRNYLLKRFWISARGFWSRRGDKLAWLFTLGMLAMIGINVGLQYGINIWNRGIFDAIEKRDASTVYYLASIFPFLVLGSVFIVTSQVYVRMRIQRRWRSWLTRLLIGRWIATVATISLI